MLIKRGLEMSKREFRRMAGFNLRRFATWRERSADAALKCLKAFPDAIRRRITQTAFQIPEGLQFIVRANSICQKRPQAICRQEQPLDLIGHPNAEGPAATGRSISITAEDASRPNRLLTHVLLVIATKKAVPNQISNLFAVRTSADFQ